ncbi:MAG: hypothetical protein R3C59_12805 [Planctomycetaceae bacterium]
MENPETMRNGNTQQVSLKSIPWQRSGRPGNRRFDRCWKKESGLQRWGKRRGNSPNRCEPQNRSIPESTFLRCLPKKLFDLSTRVLALSGCRHEFEVAGRHAEFCANRLRSAGIAEDRSRKTRMAIRLSLSAEKQAVSMQVCLDANGLAFLDSRHSAGSAHVKPKETD